MTDYIPMSRIDEAPDQTDNYQPLSSHNEEDIATNVRRVFVNDRLSNEQCSNVIHTGKYNLATFIPKFLFEQFRKYANIFFLLVAFLQQIPNVSPTGKFTTVVPLSIILMVSAVKEIIEDIRRHKGDRATNNANTLVLKNNEFVGIKWKNIKVGDIVKVINDSPIPADLLLLASSEPMAMCYIETSNLDGETNLKLRQGHPITSALLKPVNLEKTNLIIHCEKPNRNLEEFTGTLFNEPGQAFPITPTQILLRGSSLKNTKWIYGAVIYTGKETKIMMNSTTASLKRSSVDKQTNSYILGLFALLAFLTISVVICNSVWMWYYGAGIWYIQDNMLSYRNVGFMVLTAFIIFHTIIPISLQVTLEVVRFMQAQFINWDLKMYYAPTDTPAMARTSNLNEELGQIKHVFSDKTGTLTQNVMEFKCCSIFGECYGIESEDIPPHSDPELQKLILAQDTNVDLFWTILAVCHTVVPDYTDSDIDRKMIEYRASSPDEKALVVAAKEMDYIFVERHPESVTIKVMDETRVYEILHVLEFTSTRKRMSVVVRDPSGKLILMVKGADTVIYERLSNNNPFKPQTLEHLSDFAKSGLRTLCIAYSMLDEESYMEWRMMYHSASIAMEDRENKLEQVGEMIEKNLILLGATAIEDKLQDHVPDTIANLLRASISVWMLTGDKQETAINIGFSCKLLNQFQEQFILESDTLDATSEQLMKAMDKHKAMSTPDTDFALIINGKALEFALMNECRADFLKIAMSCVAVICCRVSPWQKAEVVKLVRSSSPGTTLAIGDGANDVGMIQAAQIGVGIYGVEGMQAASASDYAIAQFSFLNRLLFVHGAWNYSRITKVILYSFYKNVCLFLIQFWFAFVSGFSGQIIFDRWAMALYNVIFSSQPPFALGIFDRNVDEKYCLKYPELYQASQRSNPFNYKVFVAWLLQAVLHSIILFGIPLFAFQCDQVYSNGQTSNLMVLGNSIYTYVVVTICLKAGLEHRAWTAFSHVAIWGTILVWFLFLYIYSQIWPLFSFGAEMVGMETEVFLCPTFWLCLFLTPTMALTWDFFWKVLKPCIWMPLLDTVLHMEHRNMDPDLYFRRVLNSRASIDRVLLENNSRNRGRWCFRFLPDHYRLC